MDTDGNALIGDFPESFRKRCAEIGFDLQRFMAMEPPTAWDKRIPAFVYILRCGEFTKVGIAADVKKRVAGMQPHNPVKIEIVREALYPSRQQALIIEAAVHGTLEHSKVWHEWFRCDQAVARQALNCVAAAYRVLLPIHQQKDHERAMRWHKRYENNPALKARDDEERRKSQEWLKASNELDSEIARVTREFNERTNYVLER